MEDEGPYGNDETRCFVLANLSVNQVTSVCCVACQVEMPVFDRYPLIDGTFFLSPQKYNTDLQVVSDHRPMYLNAVCMRCMEGSRDIRCQACRKAWHGRTLLIGTMYAWDVFAGAPCCAFRLSCKQCRQPILDPESGFNFYSEYSRPIECPHCRAKDYHFVKPLDTTFFNVNTVPVVKPKPAFSYEPMAMQAMASSAADTAALMRMQMQMFASNHGNLGACADQSFMTSLQEQRFRLQQPPICN